LHVALAQGSRLAAQIISPLMQPHQILRLFAQPHQNFRHHDSRTLQEFRNGDFSTWIFGMLTSNLSN
jgi:hypothetical protein